MERQRLIFHIDVNSAFLSWESVYRLSKDPHAVDLRTIPSAVGGDAKSRHGIVLAKSVPARQYGISTAEPLVSALKKCPELTIVPSRFDLYLEYSGKLIRLLEEYTPDIEKFSIDEAFLDMTETIHLFGSPAETADRIREPGSDDSTILAALPQETLARLILPLGDFAPEDVAEMAEDFKV